MQLGFREEEELAQRFDDSRNMGNRKREESVAAEN